MVESGEPFPRQARAGVAANRGMRHESPFERLQHTMASSPDDRALYASSEVESMGGTPPDVRKYIEIHPVTEGLDAVRKFVIFNTGDTDVYKARVELSNMLTTEAYAAIVSLRGVRHKGSLPRLELTVTAELGDGLKRMIRRRTSKRTPYLMKLLRSMGSVRKDRPSLEILSKWRVMAYQPYFDRIKVDKPVASSINQPARPLGDVLLSLNVNGFHKKVAQVEDMIRTECPMIVALQETLSAVRHYPVVVKGYRTFAKPWQEGFRGQALLVDVRLPCYELPHDDSTYLIHVKVSGVPGATGPLHVFSVYLPSGGNYRKERTRLIGKLGERVNDALKADRNAAIVALGDFNIEEDALDKKLRRHAKGLLRFSGVGSTWTRFPARRDWRPSGLDHFVGSSNANLLFRKMRVLRQYPISDHRPIVLRLRRVPLAEKSEFRVVKTKINTGACRVQGKGLVSHNRWSVLAVDDGRGLEEEDISVLAQEFSKVFDVTTRSLGIKTTIGDSKRRLPRRIMTSLRKYKRYGSLLAETRANEEVPDEQLLIKYKKAGSRFKKLMKGHKLEEKRRSCARISESFVAHDHKSVWTQIRSMTGGDTGGDTLQPVRNPDGVLKTDPLDILNVHKQHYRKVMQHDPDNHAMDEDYWASKELNSERAEVDLEGINNDLRWPEALMSIRRMKRNTSPGSDGVHVNVLKQLVREECMGVIQLRNPGHERPDYTLVDLPEEELPEQPTTQMGKALFRVLGAVWTKGQIPKGWQEVQLVSLAKPNADPEIMDSYRGITLISSAEKILLGVLAERLAGVVPLAQEQGGFRKREEAIAQFLAMTEIVRRRHLDGKDTFGIFVDFKKAYDRVQHGALFRILDHVGVRGKMLNFIKKLYRKNRIRVRVGGRLSKSFRMRRGNRQGCPLSPLLYIIFINGILKECSAGGVEVPGTKRDDPNDTGALRGLGYRTVSDVCPGLIYADDVLAFEDSPLKAQLFLEKLDRWAKEWDAEIGIQKCGVICWSEKEETIRGHSETVYMAGANEIPKVAKYKYLGIWVDERLVESRGKEGSRSGTLEREYAKGQAAKGNRALYALRPFLEDHHVPIVLKAHAVRNLVLSKMLYGAEWIGYLNLNAEPLEKILQQAVRWIIGYRGSDEAEVDSFTLCYELGIPTIEEELHARRTRILAKLQREDGGFKTWLRKLYEEPPPSTWRKQTWVTGSKNWLSHARKSLPKHSDAYTTEYKNFCQDHGVELRDVPEAIQRGWDGKAKFTTSEFPLREWATLEQSFALTVRSNPYESPLQVALVNQRTLVDDAGMIIDWNEPENLRLHGVVNAPRRLGEEGRLEYLSLVRIPKGRTSEEVTQLRTVRDVVLERQMTRNKSTGFLNYDCHEFGVTRGYLRNAVSRPDLSEGVRWLTLLRIGAFPSVQTLVERLEKKGVVHSFDRECCPLCKRVLVGTIWTHLLLRCGQEWVSLQREKCLALPIRLVRDNTDWTGQWTEISPDGNFVIDERRHELLIGSALVGGWDHVKGDTIPTYSLGFGQLDPVPDGMETYGYIRVAEFLQKVAPLYLRTLGFKEYTAGDPALQPDVVQPLEEIEVVDIDDCEVEDPDIERRMGGVRIPERVEPETVDRLEIYV